MFKKLWRGLRPFSQKGVLAAVLAVALLTSACSVTDQVSHVLAKVDRNALLYKVQKEKQDDGRTYMGRFAEYMSLSLCTENVTTHCANASYVNETIMPAQKEFFVAQGELEAAVDADGYVDGEIKERAETAAQTLVDIASGETIVNAINTTEE